MNGMGLMTGSQGVWAPGPAPHRRRRAWHARPCTAQSSHGPVQSVSWSSNRNLAEKCIASIADAMQLDPSTPFYCQEGKECQFYTALLTLTLKQSPAAPLLVSVAGGACAAVCYMLPRTERVQWPALLSCLGELWAIATSVRPYRWGDVLTDTELCEARRDAFLRTHGGCALYVLTIGTATISQGQGLGSSIMRALTALADRQQVPMYLEASTPRNAALYSRFGFQALSTEAPSLKPGAPQLMFMWRPPAAAAAAAAAQGAAAQGAGAAGAAHMEPSGQASEEEGVAGSRDGSQGELVGAEALPRRSGLFSQHPMQQVRTRRSPQPDP